MYLTKIKRLNLLQSGRLNIEGLDDTYYVSKHRKKMPVIFLNKPKRNCQLLYGCATDNGKTVKWYVGMTECFTEFRVKGKRIFCDDLRPFAHASGDDFDKALKECKTACYFILFVEEGVRILEKQEIWELRNAGCNLINKQLYTNYEGYQTKRRDSRIRF